MSSLHAINVDGVAYRSFKLVTIDHTLWNDTSVRHCAVNKKKKKESKSTHLGPHRAAQKIFDSWCRTNKLNTVEPIRFVIQETTRGKKHKMCVYDGKRNKLDSPRLVTVHNKKTNQNYTISYEYQSNVKACKKSELKKYEKELLQTPSQPPAAAADADADGKDPQPVK